MPDSSVVKLTLRYGTFRVQRFATFPSGPAGNIAVDASGVIADRDTFYLQPTGITTAGNTLASVIATRVRSLYSRPKLQPAGPSCCLVHGFAANPNPIRTDGLFGATTLVGTSDCAYDIRLGSPSGALFATGASGNISVRTGDWVTDGLTFYVQVQTTRHRWEPWGSLLLNPGSR